LSILVLIAVAFLCILLLVNGLRAAQDVIRSGEEMTLENLVNQNSFQVPDVGDIKFRPHAVQKHGEDAVEARKAIQGCPPSGLRAKVCVAGSHGLSVVYWCETGLSLCPGTYTTISGLEKTSFIRPCDDWRTCR